MLVKRKVFESCGLLDEAFFMYHEEAEFCFRAWTKGFLVVVNPQHIYYHKVALSAGKTSPFSLYYRTRNNFYFLKKWKHQVRYYRLFATKYSLMVLYSFLKLSVSLLFKYNKVKPYLVAYSRAILDARSNKLYKSY